MIYDLVIIGATFLGLGALCKNPKNSIILEKSPQLGSEFINALKMGTKWNTPQKGSQLVDILNDRNLIMADGSVFLPDLAPVLYHFVSENELPVLLMTDILSIIKEKDIYNIEIFNNEGINCIQAKKIIDTTEGISDMKRFENNIIKKSLNAILWSEDNLTISDNSYKIKKCIKPGYYLMEINLDFCSSYYEARKKLHDYWFNRNEKYKKCTIAKVADCFSISLKEKYIENYNSYTLISSGCYDNPLQAFETGCLIW